MSLARRTALIDFARERDAYIFEDDHNSEFRFTGPPLPCLQGLDNSGRVIYAGTMSKILYPSLRLGYILAPEQLVEPMIKIRAVTDQHSPAIDQATLARFLTEGYFLSHIKRMRKLYSDRRDFFIEQFNQVVKRLLRSGSSGSWLTFRRLVTAENRSTVHHAGLRRNRYQAVAAVLMFHESGTGSRAYLRLRRLVSGTNSRRPDQVRFRT